MGDERESSSGTDDHPMMAWLDEAQRELLEQRAARADEASPAVQPASGRRESRRDTKSDRGATDEPKETSSARPREAESSARSSETPDAPAVRPVEPPAPPQNNSGPAQRDVRPSFNITIGRVEVRTNTSETTERPSTVTPRGHGIDTGVDFS